MRIRETADGGEIGEVTTENKKTRYNLPDGWLYKETLSEGNRLKSGGGDARRVCWSSLAGWIKRKVVCDK